VLLLDDFGLINDDDGEGTRAVTAMIGSLEINSGEPPSNTRWEAGAR